MAFYENEDVVVIPRDTDRLTCNEDMDHNCTEDIDVMDIEALTESHIVKNNHAQELCSIPWMFNFLPQDV